jgi:hypothetical protein
MNSILRVALLGSLAIGHSALASEVLVVKCSPLSSMNRLNVKSLDLAIYTEDPDAVMTISFHDNAKPTVLRMAYEATRTQFRLMPTNSGGTFSVLLKLENDSWIANVTDSRNENSSVLSCKGI